MRFQAFSVLAVAALVLHAPAGARAQQPLVLRDADVARLLPVIRASHDESARREAAVHAMITDQRAAERFQADVQAGRVDLEAVLRRHSPRASVPGGAAYDAACSRSTVLPGSSAGVRGTLMLAYALSGPAEEARAVAYYRGRGFAVSERSAASTWLEWPDRAVDSLFVGVGRVFRADDAATGCRHLVGRPVIVLRLASFALTEQADAAAPAVADASADAARARARAELTEERFGEMLGAAMIARADALDGHELEQLATLAARIADFRPQVDARRANVAWYRRHRQALEPALGRYVEQLSR